MRMRRKGKHKRRLRQPSFLSARLRRKRRVWKGLFWLALLSLTALPSVHWANRLLYQKQRTLAEPFLSLLPLQELGDRIAIIVPHPDDETLGCGGLIQWLVRQGTFPHVAIVTDGDGFDAAIHLTLHDWRINPQDRHTFASLRHAETQVALQLLGVPPENRHFLGFSERTLPADWLLRCDRQPLQALATWLAQMQPTTVFLPSRFDDHPVHATVCSLAWAALLQAHAQNALPQFPRVFEVLIHYGEFPRPQGLHTHLELLPPTDLLEQAYWYQLPLPLEFRRRKLDAIRRYKTQLPLTGRFLKSFVRTNELFAEPLPLWHQRDRKGEPRSLLPSLDIVEAELQSEEQATIASVSVGRSNAPTLLLRLRGNFSRRFRYGVHVFALPSDEPFAKSLPIVPIANTKTLACEIPDISPAVITAFTAYRDRVLDVMPMTVNEQDGVAHAGD